MGSYFLIRPTPDASETKISWFDLHHLQLKLRLDLHQIWLMPLQYAPEMWDYKPDVLALKHHHSWCQKQRSICSWATIMDLKPNNLSPRMVRSEPNSSFWNQDKPPYGRNPSFFLLIKPHHREESISFFFFVSHLSLYISFYSLFCSVFLKNSCSLLLLFSYSSNSTSTKNGRFWGLSDGFLRPRNWWISRLQNGLIIGLKTLFLSILRYTPGTSFLAIFNREFTVKKNESIRKSTSIQIWTIGK